MNVKIKHVLCGGDKEAGPPTGDSIRNRFPDTETGG